MKRRILLGIVLYVCLVSALVVFPRAIILFPVIGFAATTAALIMGGLALAGGVASSAIGGNAAKTAAQQQADAAQKGIDFQKEMFDTQQENQAPYLSAGTTALNNLMQQFSSGKFGPGSLDSTLKDLPGAPPAAPGAFTGTFTAPTLEEARATPGYQFTQTQGNKGILQGAAAAGGAISGGTLKALDQYNTGLADSTYGDVFNRSLSTYGAGLSAYNANLQGYQADLNRYAESLGKYQVEQGTAQSAQQQEFNQLALPVQLGEGSVQSINNSGTAAAANISNLMGQIGNANAAGTVGQANAVTGGIGGATSSLVQSLLFNQLFGKTAAGGKAPPIGTYGGF